MKKILLIMISVLSASCASAEYNVNVTLENNGSVSIYDTNGKYLAKCIKYNEKVECFTYTKSK